MAAPAEQNPDLSPERVSELLAEGGIQLIDVREDYEHEQGRIAGDRHIVMDRLVAEANSLDRDRPVVFYCRTGSRSAAATEAFRGAGFLAYNLENGILGWLERGLPIEGRVAPH